MRNIVVSFVLGTICASPLVGGCGAQPANDGASTAAEEQPIAVVDAGAPDTGPRDTGAPSCGTCSSPPVTTNSARTFVSDKPAKKCPLPANCTCVKGNCEWLQCFRDSQYGFGNSYAWLGSCLLSPAGGMCPLSSALEAQVAALCKGKATDTERLECIAAQLKFLLQTDPTNVCRHYASCMDDIAGILGIPTLYAVGDGATHAWNESTVQSDGGTYTVATDPYNGIEIVCAKPPVEWGNPN